MSKEGHQIAATENAALKQSPFRCFECKQDTGKSYCSACDEFYNTGHAAGCSRRNERGHEGDHLTCRY